MDSVRVDLARLQLLNDRICQCLDALNQVRVSMAPGTTFGQGFPSFGTNSPWNPTAPWVGGISHTTGQNWAGNPYSGIPSYGPFGPQTAGFAGPNFVNPYTISPFTANPFVGGLSHTSVPGYGNGYAPFALNNPYGGVTGFNPTMGVGVTTNPFLGANFSPLTNSMPWGGNSWGQGPFTSFR